MFAAKVGVLSGPIKTPFGYYVFTVDSKTPPKARPRRLAQETTTPIKTAHQSLAGVRRPNVARAAPSFGKKWSRATHQCASGYISRHLVRQRAHDLRPPDSTGATG